MGSAFSCFPDRSELMYDEPADTSIQINKRRSTKQDEGVDFSKNLKLIQERESSDFVKEAPKAQEEDHKESLVAQKVHDTQEAQEVKEIFQRDTVILKLTGIQSRVMASKKVLDEQKEKVLEEAKQHIQDNHRDRAIFALQRRKLYDIYLCDIECHDETLKKSIKELESNGTKSEYKDMVKGTNEVLTEVEALKHIEQLWRESGDTLDKEEGAREFLTLFEKYKIGDVEENYRALEQEIKEEKLKRLEEHQEPIAA